MGFFSNLNIEQESDREQAAVFQAEASEPKNQPVQAVPSADTADGMTAAQRRHRLKLQSRLKKKKLSPSRPKKKSAKRTRRLKQSGKLSGKKNSASARKRNGLNGIRRLPWTTMR